MIRLLFIIILSGLILTACGKKDMPEYKSKKNYNNIYLV